MAVTVPFSWVGDAAGLHHTGAVSLERRLWTQPLLTGGDEADSDSR